MFSLADLPPRWSGRAAEMRFLGQEPIAALIEAMLGEFETELAADASEALTIAQAAAESGYSKEHLRRLVREEQIPSAGKPNAPLIRRADVPIKPGRLASKRDAKTPSNGYDVDEDARDIAKRIGR